MDASPDAVSGPRRGDADLETSPVHQEALGPSGRPVPAGVSPALKGAVPPTRSIALNLTTPPPEHRPTRRRPSSAVSRENPNSTKRGRGSSRVGAAMSEIRWSAGAAAPGSPAPRARNAAVGIGRAVPVPTPVARDFDLHLTVGEEAGRRAHDRTGWPDATYAVGHGRARTPGPGPWSLLPRSAALARGSALGLRLLHPPGAPLRP